MSVPPWLTLPRNFGQIVIAKKCPSVALIRVEIIAHRGASHDAPENTLAAVRLAWAQAADAVEVDVHLTRDGRLAVIHDPDTRRTAGIDRIVAAATLDELQTLEVGRWKSPAFTGEKIPSLDELWPIVPEGKRIFVEVKGGADVVGALRHSVEVARRDGQIPAGRIVIISFDRRGAEAAKRALPECEVCWLADSGRDAPHPTLTEIAKAARGAGLDGIDVETAWFLDEPIVQQIHAVGIKLYVWTVDDALRARYLARLGIDGITTNRPGWLRAQMAAR
jgi:glycerophosphoryl diester phosphodiesterase